MDPVSAQTLRVDKPADKDVDNRLAGRLSVDDRRPSTDRSGQAYSEANRGNQSLMLADPPTRDTGALAVHDAGSKKPDRRAYREW
ncbi:MAG: hypothetical protein NVS2B16_00320 [Chloroflexota bacterium]